MLDVTNGDAIEGFLEENARFEGGESFRLYDVGEGQQYTVTGVKFFTLRGRRVAHLELTAPCVVCGAEFTQTKAVGELRKHRRVTRTCGCARWRTPMPDAWLTSEEIWARGKGKLDAARAKLEARSSARARAVGTTQAAVLAAVEDLALLGVLPYRLVAERAARMMDMGPGKQDMRFTMARRALRVLQDRGLVGDVIVW